MSQFVNYRNRAVTLPPGCKDLIDVLAPSQKEAHMVSYSTQMLGVKKVKKDRFPAAGLAQVAHYVTMLLESQGRFFVVSVAPSGCNYPVALYRSMDDTPAIGLLTKEAQQEQAIRAFFAKQNIEVLLECPPPDARALVYALPPEIPRAISLTTDLLRDVYGLNDETGIDFTYWSETNA